jgi:chromosome segregation ATPase
MAADEAQARCAALDSRLQTNASLTQQQGQALRNAKAEVNRLMRALKSAAKERDGLAKMLKKATAAAERAKAKAQAAEAKYDKTVLAELVRREKEKDQAEAAQRRTAGTAVHTPPDQTPADANAGTSQPTG